MSEVNSENLIQDVTTNNEVVANDAAAEVEAVPPAATSPTPASNVQVENVKTTRRTPSKRKTAVERAQAESAQLIKQLGIDLDVEGGRKTRSSTRGTPTRSAVASTPPPAKKTKGTPRRGRPKQIINEAEDDDDVDATKKREKTAETTKDSEETSVVEKTNDVTDKAEIVTETKSNEAETEVKSPEAEAEAEAPNKPAPAVVEEEEEKVSVEPVEPMEVDSAVASESVPIDEPAAAAVAEEAKDEVSSQAAVVQIIEDDIVQISNSDSTDSSIICIQNDFNKDETLSNNVKKTASSTDAEKAVVTEVEQSKNDTNNDHCEKKLSSVPPTAQKDGGVPTPQFCN